MCEKKRFFIINTMRGFFRKIQNYFQNCSNKNNLNINVKWNEDTFNSWQLTSELSRMTHEIINF